MMTFALYKRTVMFINKAMSGEVEELTYSYTWRESLDFTKPIHDIWVILIPQRTR